MNNIFRKPFTNDIDYIYDLKGSTYKRESDIK